LARDFSDQNFERGEGLGDEVGLGITNVLFAKKLEQKKPEIFKQASQRLQTAIIFFMINCQSRHENTRLHVFSHH